MNCSKAIGIVGAILVVFSLLGLPWYIITARISREVSYVFVYSPFVRQISLSSESTLFEWFYRPDAVSLGVLCGIAAILPQILRKSRRIRILSPTTIILILLFFPTLLPIHVTTAARLSLGSGLMLAGTGALLMLSSQILS